MQTKSPQLHRPGLNQTAWGASRRFSLAGSPVRVAEALGLAENAVILARFRVLKRSREESGDFFW